MTRSTPAPAVPPAGEDSTATSTAATRTGGEESRAGAAVTATASTADAATPAVAKAAEKSEGVAGSGSGPVGEDASAAPGAESGAEAGGGAAALRAQDAPDTGTAGADDASIPDGGTRAEGDAAVTVSQSRLPAFVRNLTSTAAGDESPKTAAVGRPGKAALAGAAVAGTLLLSVPFLVLGGDDDERPRTANAAGTVLGGDEQGRPGEFGVAEPEKSGGGGPKGATPSVGASPSGAPAKSAPAQAGKSPTAAAPADKAGGTSAAPAKPRSQAKSKPAGGGGQAAPASGVTLGNPVVIRNHLSGRCLNVPHSMFNDGMPLEVWDCNGTNAQSWQFASDGTLRIAGKCLDVVNANFNDGTPIQLAHCSDNAAQKFVLNEAHDLVNTVVGKCVDVNQHTSFRIELRLWTCTGADNQKWSFV
ncbi:ricin-type beta-trefoil lectin domain protein [Streptomyces sp. V2I9]|uniref:ricin-type beta-trefoil lectin domain protein n=1 Tax=Streptomyces sp. V2I9 TaxID=3042304 RepID=UPI002785AB71|nr:ricin-type beta-trefoil lectin domain protein [Streptomyces sp. V2I9]MDQ0988466.1 hypothetical protein [Streptomyces sp. V2I9]